ncbi:MAG TPA: threonine synthase [Firmicutes bacterium]|jgi:threonine synthase|nr:threonine synthase [Bacillota bacterium]
MWPGLIVTYKDYLPVSEATPIVSLHEGNTPLIPLTSLETELGGRVKIYGKLEGSNPTGSFKDRGMTMAVSKALEEGAGAVICASTGNTSASAAAYAARAGLACIVIIPAGAIAMGKLAQALMYGAKVIAIKGNFDQALNLVRQVSEKHPVILVNSINPMRLQGQKTAAFEVCDQLGEAPTYLALPVGNAGNITAYWMGFKEYYQAKRISSKPKMLGFEAEGAAAIVRGKPIPAPETVATAIRIGNPASWEGAMRAARESGGQIASVTDPEILDAYKLLAEKEGLFVEPASAASVAGVMKFARKGYFKEGDKIVCVLTGNGLKDPDIALKSIAPPSSVEADLSAVEKAIWG